MGLAVWAASTGAYVDKPHQHNYQVPAGDEITTTSPTPSLSPSPTQTVKVVLPSHAPVKRALVQPLDEADPTTDTPTPDPTTPETTPPDNGMPTDDGTQGPGGFSAPPPPSPHPTPTRPGQHTPSGQPND